MRLRSDTEGAVAQRGVSPLRRPCPRQHRRRAHGGAGRARARARARAEAEARAEGAGRSVERSGDAGGEAAP